MWNRDQFEQAASQVAKTFAESNGDQSINQLSTKIAREGQLNPDGIRTLVRLSNTAAFQELFAKRAGADDRMIEFETGDPEIVIANLHNEQVDAMSSMPKMASSYDRAQDYFGDFYFDKTASEPCCDPHDETHFTGKDKKVEECIDAVQSSSTKKLVKEKLEDEKKEASYRWGHSLEKAAQEFRVSFNGKKSFSKVGFYQDAVAYLGAGFLPELRGLNVMTGGNTEEDLLGGFKVAHVEQFVLPVLDAPVKRVYDHLKEASSARAAFELSEKALKYLDA